MQRVVNKIDFLILILWMTYRLGGKFISFWWNQVFIYFLINLLLINIMSMFNLKIAKVSSHLWWWFSSRKFLWLIILGSSEIVSLSNDKLHYCVDGSTPCIIEFKWIENNNHTYKSLFYSLKNKNQIVHFID